MNDIFKSNIPQWAKVVLMIVAIFPHLMILSMYSMNSTFSASYLDLETYDLQFLFGLAYAAIVATLFYHVRLFHFLNIRNYLLITTMLNMVVLVLMTLTTNTQVILALRFLQGPLAMLEGCILIPLLMNALKSKHAKFIAYSILYLYLMTSDKVSAGIVKIVIENYSHNFLLYGIVILHAAALLIYLLSFNHKRLFPHKPLYKLHIPGGLFVVISMIAGAYCLVYGKKYEWFDDYRIIWSFALCLVAGALFIVYQFTIKRPMFHFEMLKSKRVVWALVLFVVFYLLRLYMSNVYQVMATVWQWPWTNILNLQYYNVLGTVIGATIGVFCLIKNVNHRYTFFISFVLLGVSLYWVSTLFYPDISPDRILLPLVLQGIGQGLMFTPLAMYLFGSVQPSLTNNVALAGTATRFWANMLGFAFFQQLIFSLTTQKQFNLSSQLDITNATVNAQWDATYAQNSASYLPNDATHLTALKFEQELYNQSLLLTNIDIATALAYVAFAFALIVLLYEPIKNYLGKRILSMN